MAEPLDDITARVHNLTPMGRASRYNFLTLVCTGHTTGWAASFDFNLGPERPKRSCRRLRRRGGWSCQLNLWVLGFLPSAGCRWASRIRRGGERWQTISCSRKSKQRWQRLGCVSVDMRQTQIAHLTICAFSTYAHETWQDDSGA